MSETTTTKRRPVYSNLDAESRRSGAVWANTNSKTGAVFHAVVIDAMTEIDGIDADITLNPNKYKVDGDNRPDLYGKKAVAWRGVSKHAGIPTLTVKITDEDLVACLEAADLPAYYTMYDNSVHQAAAPAE